MKENTTDNVVHLTPRRKELEKLIRDFQAMWIHIPHAPLCATHRGPEYWCDCKKWGAT